MTVLLLPRPRQALRHPGVRAALLLLVAGPPVVAWWGKDADAPIRLRLLGMAVAVAVALAWDDRAHVLTTSTPVGLPAVRRGRVLVVALLAVAAFALGWLAVPGGASVPVGSLVLQSISFATLLLVVVGWFGRDGESVLVVPLPALLLSVVVMFRLPERVALLRADPRSPEWADERIRWWVLLGVCVLLVARLQRDPAARPRPPSPAARPRPFSAAVLRSGRADSPQRTGVG